MNHCASVLTFKRSKNNLIPNFFFNIYLSVLGLSCGMQDLSNFSMQNLQLQHSNS